MRVSLQTSLVQLAGICVCGFALKKSNQELIFATSILIYSLLHFILGLIVHSNPIASKVLILIYDKSSTLSTCLYVPLLNIQLLAHYDADLWHLKEAIVVTSLVIAFVCLRGRYWHLLLDIFTVTQCVLLLFLSTAHDKENFWLHSLAILTAMNYFTIPALVDRYAVPRQELLSVSLIFQNLFLLRAMF